MKQTTLNKDLDFQLEILVSKLKRRQISGSFEVTIEIAKLFRIIIAGGRWNILKDLYDICDEVQDRLNNAHQVEFAVDTTMKRICTLIEEENADYMAQSDSLDELNEKEMDEGFRDVVKPLLLQGLTELIDETELSSSNISIQAFDHIHSSEIIMTLGYSMVVADFLKEAAKVRKFQVLVAETAPEFDGQKMAVLLANSGIETTVIQDSAIYALMSRVNKVILGVHAGIGQIKLVTISGGVLAPTGTQIVASAAMHHSTPVVVCVCTHSLTSDHLNTDMDKYSHCISPENVFGFQNGSIAKHVYLPNPRLDYIPSEKIKLFITNVGPHPPSEIQRIIAELKV